MSALAAILLWFAAGAGGLPSWPPPSAEGAGAGPCRYTIFVAGAPEGEAWSVYRRGQPSPLATRERRDEAEDVALEIALDLGRARLVSCGPTRDGWAPETDATYGCTLPDGEPPECPTPPE